VATRPYSRRFISAEGANFSVVWTVPEGQRAVVRGVSYYVPGQTGAKIFLQAHGIYCWMALAPVTEGSKYEELRLVLYERETLRVDAYGTGWGIHVSGFIFSDEEGRPDDPVRTLELPRRPAALPTSTTHGIEQTTLRHPGWS
jgi:hypothetical protein